MLPLIAFLTSIAFLPGITSAAYAPRWWVLLILAPLALMTIRVHMTRGHWLGLLFCFVCSESLVWSISPLDTINALIQLVALGMVFCVAAEQEDMEPVWLAIGAGAAFNAAVAAWSLFSGHDLVERASYAGLFFQRDFMGSFCAVALVGIVTGTRRSLTSICLALACIGGVALSTSRGAWLALGVALAATVVHRQPKHLRFYAALGFMLLTPVVGLVMYRWRPESVDMRFLEWDWLTQNLHWFGWGFNTLGSVLSFEHAENDLLELAFDLGVMSLVFWVFVVIALRGYRYAPASFIVLVATLACGLTSFPLRNPATAMVAAVALGSLCSSRGYLFAARRQSRNVRQSNFGPVGHRGSARDVSPAPRRLPAGQAYPFHR